MYKKFLAALLAAMLLLSCASANTITLPPNLTLIAEEMFEGSGAVDNVVLADGLTRIESRAFANSSIATINLPDSITYIAPDAFDNCDVIAYVNAGSYARQYCEEHGISTRPATLFESFSTMECRRADWFESEVNTVFYRRNISTGVQCVATLYDVTTGISLKVRRVGGDFHADIETMTKADTAKLCEIQHVSSPSQITSGTPFYERRPCLLLVGRFLYACSWYAVPHDGGRPSSEPLLDNDLNGYIMCLHFLNSRGHGSGSVDPAAQEAMDIAYAWWQMRFGSGS